MTKIALDSILYFVLFIATIWVLLIEFFFFDSIEWFAGGARLSQISVSICLSFIAAYIFYFLTIQVPKKRDLAQLREISAPLLNDILFHILMIMQGATNKKLSQKKLKLEALTVKEFSNAMNDIYFDTLLRDSCNGMTVGKSVVSHIEQLKSTSRELLSYVLHMEPSYIALISKVIRGDFYDSWCNSYENYGKVQTANNIDLPFMTVGNDLSKYASNLEEYQKLYKSIECVLCDMYKDTEVAKKYIQNCKDLQNS